MKCFILSTTYVIAAFAFVSCTNSSSKFLEKLKRATEEQQNATAPIDFARLTDFSWDRVVIFAPYTPLERIDAQLGQSSQEVHKTGIHASDTFHVIVFVNGNAIAQHVKVPRTVGDFGGLEQTNAFYRSNAVFSLKRQAGRIVFEPANAGRNEVNSTRQP